MSSLPLLACLSCFSSSWMPRFSEKSAVLLLGNFTLKLLKILTFPASNRAYASPWKHHDLLVFVSLFHNEFDVFQLLTGSDIGAGLSSGLRHFERLNGVEIDYQTLLTTLLDHYKPTPSANLFITVSLVNGQLSKLEPEFCWKCCSYFSHFVTHLMSNLF